MLVDYGVDRILDNVRNSVHAPGINIIHAGNGVVLDIARTHIRIFQPGAFIRGATMVDWVTNFNTFQMYKRMWIGLGGEEASYKIDDQRVNVLNHCAFMTFTPVGVGLAGITGDMDEAIAVQGLAKVVHEDLGRMMDYAEQNAPPFRERVTEIAFLTAFTKSANLDGEIIYSLRGVVHTDSRLIPAITQI